MTLVDTPYPELVPNEALSSVVKDELHSWDPTRPAAHLNCGTGLLTRRATGRYDVIGVDPQKDLIDRAIELGTQHPVDASMADHLDRHTPLPVRSAYTFCCEALDNTGISTGSVDRVLLERGHRGDLLLEGITDEIHRIGLPGCRVVIVDFGPLELELWAINDPLARQQQQERVRLGRPVSALKAFGFRQVAVKQDLFAIGRFGLAEVMRALDDSPEGKHSLANGFWMGTASLHQTVRKLWFPKNLKLNVRRRAAVYVGTVPMIPPEPTRDGGR